MARAAIDRAGVTLRDGARFLGAGLGGRWAGLIDGPSRGKVLGNGLRELDRFLSVLLGEIAALYCDGEEQDRFDRLRNTARKFESLCALLGRPPHELARLRAIGRCRDCLFHTGGIVRRADDRGGASMTIGWPGQGGHHVVALGAILPVTAEDLTSICRFYEATADAMMGLIDARFAA
ncbi:hypothetical protein [Sphingomonas abietis]|uniref:Uncharacterized protein n=1 Tax=Sphingomonas abietis TaxID=3012344 RepID=A0ABY7NUG6_9SPHN|nr:hypothetical protein [Sphingomonas abietis]WBO23106.1 hypothetical protein PBT88_02905 [Sphingomonas abietis]